jgi:hypothetical protein
MTRIAAPRRHPHGNVHWLGLYHALIRSCDVGYRALAMALQQCDTWSLLELLASWSPVWFIVATRPGGKRAPATALGRPAKAQS